MTGASNPLDSAASPLLEVIGLKKYFPIRRKGLSRPAAIVHAVDGVSFTLRPSETLGLVGESGCGKTTVGKTIMRLLDPTEGQIFIEGRETSLLSKAEMRPIRQSIQMVFQDPFSSLNPRMRVGAAVAEPLEVHGVAAGKVKDEQVAALFKRVGLHPEQMHYHPNEFSGGQRQRIGIARALALNPKIIVADEPVSSLDVSIQAQVINLLMDLQEEYDISYLFIAHDLAVVEYISDRIAVMYLGKIVELADKQTIFSAPAAPLHRSSVRRRAGSGSQGVEGQPQSVAGRGAEPHQSAQGVQIPHAVPDRRRTMPARGAVSETGDGKSPGGLPPALRR